MNITNSRHEVILLNNELLNENAIKLIADNTDPKKYFHKKKYAAYFEKYCADNEEFFKSLNDLCNDISDEELTNLFNELSLSIVKCAKSQTESLKRINKENKKSELNLFMVTSVFPCILKMLPENGEKFCESLKATWKSEFYGLEIGYTTYEKLCDSFRSFWGFLTGR